jgi:hypothetical protein
MNQQMLLLYFNERKEFMRNTKHVPLLLLTFFMFSSLSFASDLFWVSFGIDDVFLMQIDLDGNVTKAPKLVGTDTQLGGSCDCNTAMTPLGDRIVIWSTNDVGGVFRILVDKTTFSTLSIKTTNLTQTESDAIAATQNGPRSFIEFETGDAIAKAFGLDSHGKLDGTSWRLCPRLDHDLDGSTVASDGGMALCDTDTGPTVLYSQTLNQKGLPNSTPSPVGSFDGFGEGIEDRQVSNALAGGTRFVIYRIDETNEIFLQVINAFTGKKIGGKRLLTIGGSEEKTQGIAIEPYARFFLFTQPGDDCPDNDILSYQALDASGNPAGKAKTIVNCEFINAVSHSPGDDSDIMGLDVLPQ